MTLDGRGCERGHVWHVAMVVMVVVDSWARSMHRRRGHVMIRLRAAESRYCTQPVVMGMRRRRRRRRRDRVIVVVVMRRVGVGV